MNSLRGAFGFLFEFEDLKFDIKLQIFNLQFNV